MQLRRAFRNDEKDLAGQGAFRKRLSMYTPRFQHLLVMIFFNYITLVIYKRMNLAKTVCFSFEKNNCLLPLQTDLHVL